MVVEKSWEFVNTTIYNLSILGRLVVGICILHDDIIPVIYGFMYSLCHLCTGVEEKSSWSIFEVVTLISLIL